MTDNNQILLWQADDGSTRLAVTVKDGNLWLTQAQMAELFQADKSVISKHISNLFATGELDMGSAVVAKNATTARDGKVYQVTYYSLRVIIHLGFRVNSHRGIQFRNWASQQLGEYVVKGFLLNDQKMMGGEADYFDELLERVRHIRTSERHFYQKVLDIFAMSIDYDQRAQYAKDFFAIVQNKFHFAITGQTAAEIVSSRVDSTKPFMGMTNWQGEVITLQQATVAKNYLEGIELKRLELLVEQFLSFAELRSIERTPMYMRDWQKKLDEFLTLNEKEILTGKGNVSHESMEAQVRAALRVYNVLAEGISPKPLPSGNQKGSRNKQP